MRHASVLLICTALAACGGSEPEPTQSLPRHAIPTAQKSAPLVFAVHDLDLGQVLQDDVKPVEYPFRVLEGEACTITALNTSCGCTEARLLVDGVEWPLGKEIPGGSEGVVEAEFHAEKYSGVKPTTVSVVLGDEAEMLTLKLVAEIKPAFELRPDVVRFGRIPRGKGGQFELMVTGIRAWEVTEWLRMPQWISVEDTGRASRGTALTTMTRRLRILVDPATPDGSIFGECVAATSMGKNLTIEVRATIVGPLVFQPAGRVTFGVVPRGSNALKLLSIESTNPRKPAPKPEVEIEGDESFLPEVQDGGAPGAWQVLLRLAPEAQAGPHEATLHVRFDGEFAAESRDLTLSAIVEALEGS